MSFFDPEVSENRTGDTVVFRQGYYENNLSAWDDVLKLRISATTSDVRVVIADGGKGTDTVDVGYASTALSFDLFREIIDLTGTTTISPTGNVTTLIGFENVIGSGASDHITGSTGDNVIKSYGGNDRINALDGADRIFVHNGDDVVVAGAGNDYVNLGVGNNEAYGGSGTDVIIAYNGSDRVSGGAGKDTIYSGAFDILNRYEDRTIHETTGHDGARPAVFIVLDDAWSVLSFMDAGAGRFADITSNLNALSAGATTFTNAFATSTMCAPSRASFLSSTMPSENGTTGGLSDRGTPDTLMLPQYFQQNGITSGSFGKFFNHTEPSVTGLDFFEFERTQVNLLKAERAGPNGFLEEVSVRDGLFDETKTFARKEGVTDAAWATIQKDIWADIETAENAAEKLGELGQTGDAFFMGVGFQFPHTPYHLPQEYIDYMDANFDIEDYRELAEELGFQLGVRGESDWLLTVGQQILDTLELPNELDFDTEAEAVEIMKYYLASIKFADDQIGKVVDAARAHTPDAVIMVTSDHGYHLGDHEKYGKSSLWPMASRVPLIVSDPEVEGGAVIDGVVSLLDVFPTLADLMGVEKPEHARGSSLYEHIKAGQTVADWDGVAVVEISENYSLTDMTGYAVTKGTYYYIRYVDNSEELYDLSSDPRAYQNLLNSAPEQYADIAEELSAYIPRGNDTVKGGPGDDLIVGGAGNDMLFGQGDDDVVMGMGGDDRIYGGNGNDVLNVGAGGQDKFQQMNGGAGDDLYIYEKASGKVIINGFGEQADGGIDTVQFADLAPADITLGSYDYFAAGVRSEGIALRLLWEMGGNSGELRIADMARHIEHVEFSNGEILTLADLSGDATAGSDAIIDSQEDSLIYGRAGDDLIFGGGGRDRIFGNTGDDTLHAGSAEDDRFQRLSGGSGDDVYIYEKDSGRVFIGADAENSTGGMDRVRLSDLNLADVTVGSFDYTGTGASSQGVALTLTWTEGDRSGELRIANGAEYIEEFEFANGQIVTADYFMV